jgi:5-formyltetrahydrofolate cyclo-ligase
MIEGFPLLIDPTIKKKKEELREQLKRIRAEITTDHRQKAADHALLALTGFLLHHTFVLSFASFGTEFDTWPINQLLAQENRLLLPRVEKNKMRIFQVTDLEKQLETSSWGAKEPIIESCQEIDADKIALILVPALGFDRSHHRIGYGKRYYDHFLQTVPTIPAFGLGFQEQLVESGLPIYPDDVALNGLFLF